MSYEFHAGCWENTILEDQSLMGHIKAARQLCRDLLVDGNPSDQSLRIVDAMTCCKAMLMGDHILNAPITALIVPNLIEKLEDAQLAMERNRAWKNLVFETYEELGEFGTQPHVLHHQALAP